MINYITIAACAVTLIVVIITIIADNLSSSNEMSEKKLLKIRKNIKKQFAEYGYATSVEEGEDYVKYNGTKWRVSVLKNDYGSATIWLTSFYRLKDSFPNVSPDGIRLAAAYAGQLNWYINFAIRDMETNRVVVVFHYDSKNGKEIISALKKADSEHESFSDDFQKMVATFDDEYLEDKHKEKRKVGFYQPTLAKEAENANVVAQTKNQ